MIVPSGFEQSLPNPTQTLLLKACLLEKEESIHSWNKWIELNGYTARNLRKSERLLPRIFDSLDFGSQRMLSLLYRKMSGQGIQDPLVDELKGYYRYVWMRNQLLRTALEEVATLFTQAKIEFVIIKGFPILESYYKDLGTRSVLDLDIAVHSSSWAMAEAVLANHGWTHIGALLNPGGAENTLVHAIPWRKGQWEIDLHIRFLHTPLVKETEREFWAGARPYKPLHNMLKPEHQLVCSFAHGYQGIEEVAMRAIVDGSLILRHSSINWHELIEVVRATRLIVPCGIFLSYLKQEEFAAIPDGVLETVMALPVNKREYAYFKLLGKRARPNGLKEFRLRIFRSSMMTPSLAKKIRLFVNTYKFQWGVKSLSSLLIMSIVTLYGKIWFPNRKIEARQNRFH